MTRVKGHKLVAEVTGYAVAQCQCGAQSDELPTIRDRRTWHRHHKREVVNNRPVGSRIRWLPDDEPVPTGVARRYLNSNGYVVMRWKVEVGSYVELSEHRAIMGNPPDKHVHHIDRDRRNNNPSNLKVVTVAEHGREHVKFSDEFWEMVRDRYVSGIPTTELSSDLGVHPSTISRELRKRNMKMAAPTGPDAWTRKPITHCAQGHEFTAKNTIHTRRQRRCKKCRAEYRARPQSQELARERKRRFLAKREAGRVSREE